MRHWQREAGCWCGAGGVGFVVPVVALRHHKTLEKKSQMLYNNVIEEMASKLVKTRKSRVKALVGAFESVISKMRSST
jgi:ligand-binding sensor protein